MSNTEIDSPLVSIIMPCYNGEKYLSETLESVYKQTYENWECIIMDDGSTDNSKQVALSFENKDKRFKYYYQENRGPSAARNNAIKLSTGKYILPFDADDKILPPYIEKAVEVLEREKDMKLVYCKARLFGKENIYWDLRPYSYKELLMENMIFCSALFRREDFDKTKGYWEEMAGGYEDWEFWISLLNESDKVFQLPDVYFYYRIHEHSRNPDFNEGAERKDLHRMICERHKDLIDKYFPIVDLLHEYSVLKNKYEVLQVSYSNAIQSASIKIGRAVLKPYWFIKKIFH